MATPPKKKVISESYSHQINVLKTLSAEGTYSAPRQLSEIAARSGLGDEKEVLRYLYILEGQKLVSPQPEGDFTSKTWCITKDGVRALGLVSQATVQ